VATTDFTGQHKEPKVAASGPLSLNEVLARELGELRPGAFDDFKATPFRQSTDPVAHRADKSERAANLRILYHEIGELGKGGGTPRGNAAPLSALCLSGGGIRSATFNLGVLQALAKLGLLGTFDYLSSVSGGGYIAGWLKAWMCRVGSAEVISALAGSAGAPRNPLEPEPKPLDSLREYSNYLTPKLGLFSPDTWTAAATYLRNLLLNWFVLLPALAALATIPQFAFLVTQTEWHPHQPILTDGLRVWRWTLFEAVTRLDLVVSIAVILGLVASYNVHRYRRRNDTEGTTQGLILIGALVPLWCSTLVLSMAALWLPFPWRPRLEVSPTPATITEAGLWGFAALWCIVIPMVGWGLAELGWKRTPNYTGRLIELLSLAGSGLVAAAILVGAVHVLHPPLRSHPALYVVLALPVLLLVYLFARTLYVAFAAWGENQATIAKQIGVATDADREWWARFSGWILLSMSLWCAVSALCLFSGFLVRAVPWAANWLPGAAAGLTGISGVITTLVGRSGDTSSGRTAERPSSPVKKWALVVAAPLFALSLGILLAAGAMWLGRVLIGRVSPFEWEVLIGQRVAGLSVTHLSRYLLTPLALVLIAVIMSRFVNVNRFSLHGFYRNRLVRAYLGASNTDRQPNRFTGFASTDNVPLAELWCPKATRPLPVINTSLNLVMSQRKLAWQQRKAESFSMTPFYCGNFHEGYRPTVDYGGGITLGTAMTISGAAASPNMGYHSSPSITFLMTLFNARLGAWLGNTNQYGDETYTRHGPALAMWPLFADLLGQTNATHSYVNLTDGGHFDNLGLYEMVLRRCRHIVVSDAGRDPIGSFEDLGNAIRKIRIDFGISIEFAKRIRILPRSTSELGLYCAVGTIQYQDIDGAGVENGTLIYLKPAVTGRGDPIPYDVFSYAQTAQDFPHESTSDQWFDEAQFESYRALGLHMVTQITKGRTIPTFPDFRGAVEEYLARSQGTPWNTLGP
jgi:hypothetical protein